MRRDLYGQQAYNLPPVSATVTFGTRLCSLRRQRRWSQLQLGIRADMSANHIHYLEHSVGEPNLATLRRVATAFGITLSQLLEGVA